MQLGTSINENGIILFIGTCTLDILKDYIFETIEIVSKSDNILEREKYWIQKCYKEKPHKSLNIMCTANIDTNAENQLNLFETDKKD